MVSHKLGKNKEFLQEKCRQAGKEIEQLKKNLTIAQESKEIEQYAKSLKKGKKKK